MRRNSRRKGFLLIGVVLLMAILLGLLSVLALTSGHILRQRRTAELRTVARTLVDSGTAYARIHFRSATAAPPTEPVDLDVTSLLPSSVRGSLQLSFSKEGGRTTCRVAARTESARMEVQDGADLVCTSHLPEGGEGT